MINDTINKLKAKTKELIDAIRLDIEDVKEAEHERLLERNELKLEAMETLAALKSQLNEELTQEFKDGVDIKIYREAISELELDLKELYRLNGKLGSLVLPVKEMYKEIIDEITAINGGSLVEVMA